MHEAFSRTDSGFSSPPLRNDLVMLAPDSLPVLADVCEQSGFFLFEDRSDVHVSIGQETL